MIKNAKKFLELIRQARTFLICSHVNPDPDAFASELALSIYLESIGKKVHVVAEDAPSKHMGFMPGIGKVHAIGRRTRLDYDVAVIMDCGDLDRIGKIKRLLREGRPIVNIDHHVTNTKFGDLNYVDAKASSTSELIYSLFKGWQVSLPRDIAYLIYTGIMTDTGSFRYTNTSAHTHAIIAELLKYDFLPQDIFKLVYENVPLADLKYFTQVASEFDALHDGALICVDLPKRIVNKFSKEFDLRDKIFGLLRSIKGVEVLMIFTEDGKNRTRVNFRSQGSVDVAQIAYYFNGGGHSKASGCILDCDMKAARRRILKRVAREVVRIKSK
ncbi:MAG TPA: bifunctional oligoribonuclease/PAP phosphatase NrnA [Candidatus Omnitrophota bacterium]|jgi:phosphoesterase RecJ-like protein|nr:bifunctional oligoribonuclease/PAP phosphatase NrnA [Candidatus Omnitrophota bacterium]